MVYKKTIKNETIINSDLLEYLKYVCKQFKQSYNKKKMCKVNLHKFKNKNSSDICRTGRLLNLSVKRSCWVDVPKNVAVKTLFFRR